MRTTNVTPSPKGKAKQQKNSKEHIALVLQEVAIKLTRKLTDEEGAAAWKFADTEVRKNPAQMRQYIENNEPGWDILPRGVPLLNGR